MSAGLQIELERAVETSDAAEVERLCAAGARATGTVHGMNVSIIALAADVADVHVVEVLVRHGAEVNEADSKGRTLLSRHAAEHDRSPGLECLLRNGADPNITDQRGWAPVHFAAGYGYVANVRWLQQYGANVRLATDSGLLPTDLAAANGYDALAIMLIPS